MLQVRDISVEISRITTALIEQSICDEQNFPATQIVGDVTEITISHASDLSIALKNLGYREIYEALAKNRAYNYRLLDGSLIQMLYAFDRSGLTSHRLAFFPSPFLPEYQEDPELYLLDDLFADVLTRNTVAFPIRFDFNRAERIGSSTRHPKSHLTLGQYPNCRIPVSGPLTPIEFIRFILTHFYNTKFRQIESEIPKTGGRFAEEIAAYDKQEPHLVLCALTPPKPQRAENRRL